MEKLDFKSIQWWPNNENPPQDFIDDVNARLDKIQSSLESVSQRNKEDALEKKSKMLEGLIKHYLDLTKVLDQRRGDYYKAALQMTAIGLTGFGLLLKLIDFSPLTVISLLSISVCLGLLSMLVTAFLVIDRYYWQGKSDRYHFLKLSAPKVKVVGNSWIWFYHGVPGIDKIPYTANSCFDDAKKFKNQQTGIEKYLEGAEFYFDQFTKATTEDFYREHLKHTYMLLVHNAYKNKFDRQLTEIMHIGTRTTYIIVITAIFLSLGAWLIPSVHFSAKESSTELKLNNDTLNIKVVKSEVLNVIPNLLPTELKQNGAPVPDTGEKKITIGKTDANSNQATEKKRDTTRNIEPKSQGE